MMLVECFRGLLPLLDDFSTLLQWPGQRVALPFVVQLRRQNGVGERSGFVRF